MLDTELITKEVSLIKRALNVCVHKRRIQGTMDGCRGIHHGWLQKEGYTALFKWSTNGVQMDIPSVSYSLHLYIPNTILGS